MYCKLRIGKIKNKAGFIYFKLRDEDFVGGVKRSKNTSAGWTSARHFCRIGLLSGIPFNGKNTN
jgi:hypothetical protein